MTPIQELSQLMADPDDEELLAMQNWVTRTLNTPQAPHRLFDQEDVMRLMRYRRAYRAGYLSDYVIDGKTDDAQYMLTWKKRS